MEIKEELVILFLRKEFFPVLATRHTSVPYLPGAPSLATAASETCPVSALKTWPAQNKTRLSELLGGSGSLWGISPQVGLSKGSTWNWNERFYQHTKFSLKPHISNKRCRKQTCKKLEWLNFSTSVCVAALWRKTGTKFIPKTKKIGIGIASIRAWASPNRRHLKAFPHIWGFLCRSFFLVACMIEK